MADILIDGYNLIGIAHGNLEQARNDIIEKLQQYAGRKRHRITLVFDGWKNGNRTETRITSRNLTIIYSRLGEKADTTIQKLIQSSEKPWIVVSSDREVSGYAERKDHAAVSSDDFERKLYEALACPSQDADQDDAYDEDITDFSNHAAGNPRQPSRKQKKKLQALKKL